MKLCAEQWKAAKAAETTNGETWPQFLAQCRCKCLSAEPLRQPAAPAPKVATGALEFASKEQTALPLPSNHHC